MLYLFLQAQMLAEDADNGSVDRSLEAYLLWLFGCIMFNNNHGDSVDRVLMPYAREIADAAEDDVPTWSWDSADAAMYRGFYDACSKTNENAYSPDTRFCCSYGYTRGSQSVGPSSITS